MILFVDDDANLLAALRRNLSISYEIDTETSAEAAVERIKNKGEYAVIISDIQMPGMDGIELLKEAHRIAPNSVKIALSGWAGKDQVIDAVNHGHIYRYLTKPIAIPQLREVIDGAIECYLEDRLGPRAEDLTREAFVQWGRELNHAIEGGQLFLVYQPQVELASGKLTGFEALIRWSHPTYGLVMPSEFISTAEINGMIVPMTRWALKTACRKIADLNKSHGRLKVAVNISAAHLDELDLVRTVKTVLREVDLEPWQLELELTETEVVENLDVLRQSLTDLTDMGVGFALDDFGSGFMNFSYLRELPVRKLKIDSSFVRGMLSDDKCAAIVHSLVTVGRSMNLTIVAEGLEEPEHLRCLEDMGCDLGQGYFFAKPLQSEDLDAWIDGMSATSETSTG